MKLILVVLICTISIVKVFGDGQSIYWTRWLDRDNPSGLGDFELYEAFANTDGNPPCKTGFEAVDAKCRVKYSKIPWQDSNDTIAKINQCTPIGFACANPDQPDGICEDYEVQFLCGGKKIVL